MDLFKFWNVLKTGTGAVLVLGAAGVLCTGAALALNGDLSWETYGMGAWTVLTGTLAGLRGRYGTLKAQIAAQQARDVAERIEKLLLDGRAA